MVTFLLIYSIVIQWRRESRYILASRKINYMQSHRLECLRNRSLVTYPLLKLRLYCIKH